MKIFTPQMNDGAHCFVFGSNEAGNHAGGAACEAAKHWGAIQGVGFGPTGESFAIPTMDWNMEPLSLIVIQHYVSRFIAFARIYEPMIFLVTPIGTGICGYSESQIAPMFNGAPANCVLPEGWDR